MRTLPSLPALLAAALLAWSCAGRTPYDPWLIPKDQFFASTKTVALVPVGVPEELEDPDPIRARFDSLMHAELRRARFIVVPSEETGAIWQRLGDSAGGLFDPVSGRPDTIKLTSLRAAWRRELRERFNVDATLSADLVLVSAMFDQSTAKWDGTSQKFESFGGAFLRTLLTSSSRKGEIPALSVSVVIQDLAGKTLYVNRGGLQIWTRPTRTNNFERVPRTELFVDEERNLKAVRLALGPIAARADSLGARP